MNILNKFVGVINLTYVNNCVVSLSILIIFLVVYSLKLEIALLISLEPSITA